MNNAVARAAGLLAVAVLPVVAGLSGDDYTDPVQFDAGFRVALTVAAALLVLAAAVSATTIRNDVLAVEEPAAPAGAPAGAPGAPGAPAEVAAGAPRQPGAAGAGRATLVPLHHCALEGPPLCGDPVAPGPARQT